MDLHLAIIFLPTIALVAAVLFNTRKDEVTSEALDTARSNPFLTFKIVMGCIIAPFIIISYLDTQIGVFLLTTIGLIFIFSGKLFPAHTLISDLTSKIFGYIYLVICFLWALST
jgi:hypothetical protein